MDVVRRMEANVVTWMVRRDWCVARELRGI